MTMIRNPSKRTPKNNSERNNKRSKRDEEDNKESTVVTSTTHVDDDDSEKNHIDHHPDPKKDEQSTTTATLRHHNEHVQERFTQRQTRQQPEPKKKQHYLTNDTIKNKQQQQQHLNNVVLQQRLHHGGVGGVHHHNDSSKMAQIHEMHPHRYDHHHVKYDKKSSQEEEDDFNIRGGGEVNIRLDEEEFHDEVAQEQLRGVIKEHNKHQKKQQREKIKEDIVEENRGIRQQQKHRDENDQDDITRKKDDMTHEEEGTVLRDEKEDEPHHHRHSRLREPIEHNHHHHHAGDVPTIPYDDLNHHGIIDPGPLTFGPPNNPDLLVLNHRGKAGSTGSLHHETGTGGTATTIPTNATAGTVPPMDFYSVVALVFAIGGFVVIVLLLFTPTNNGSSGNNTTGGEFYMEKRGSTRRKHHHNKKKHSPGAGPSSQKQQHQQKQGSSTNSVKSRRSIKKKQDDYYYESDYEPTDDDDNNNNNYYYDEQGDINDGSEFLDDSLDDLISYQKAQELNKSLSTTTTTTTSQHPQMHHHHQYNPSASILSRGQQSILTHRVVAASKQQNAAGLGGTVVSNMSPPLVGPPLPQPVRQSAPMTPSHHWMIQQQQQQQAANVSPVNLALHVEQSPAVFDRAAAPPPPPPVMFSSSSGPPSSNTSNSFSDSYNKITIREDGHGDDNDDDDGEFITSRTGRQPAGTNNNAGAPLKHAGLSGFLSPPAFIDDEDLTTEDEEGQSDVEGSRTIGGDYYHHQAQTPVSSTSFRGRGNNNAGRCLHHSPQVSPIPVKLPPQPVRHTTLKKEEEKHSNHAASTTYDDANESILRREPSTHLDTLLVDSDAEEDDHRSNHSGTSGSYGGTSKKKNLVHYQSASSNDDEYEYGEEDDDDVSVALEQGEIIVVSSPPPHVPPGRGSGGGITQQSSSRSLSSSPAGTVPFYYIDASTNTSAAALPQTSATASPHPGERKQSDGRGVSSSSCFRTNNSGGSSRSSKDSTSAGYRPSQVVHQQRNFVKGYDATGINAVTSTCSSVSLTSDTEEEHHGVHRGTGTYTGSTPSASPKGAFQHSTTTGAQSQQQQRFSPNFSPYGTSSAGSTSSAMRNVALGGNGGNGGVGFQSTSGHGQETPRIHNAGDRTVMMHQYHPTQEERQGHDFPNNNHFVAAGAEDDTAAAAAAVRRTLNDNSPYYMSRPLAQYEQGKKSSPGPPPMIPHYNYSTTQQHDVSSGPHQYDGSAVPHAETTFVPFLPNLSKTGDSSDGSPYASQMNALDNTNNNKRGSNNNDSDSILLLDPYLNAPSQKNPTSSTSNSIDFGDDDDEAVVAVANNATATTRNSGDTEFSFAIPSEGKHFRMAMSTDETFSSSADHESRYAMLNPPGGATSYDEAYKNNEDYCKVKRVATKAARQRRKMSNEELEEYMKSQVRMPESPFAPRPEIQEDGTMVQKHALPFPSLDNISNGISSSYTNDGGTTMDDDDDDDEEENETGVKHVRKNLVKEDSDASASLSGYIKFNELNLIEVIGGGGFGQVYRATWHGTPVAVKVIHTVGGASPSKKVLEEFAAEINLLSGMRHPNICLYIGACLEPPNFAIITELAANGSLWDALRLPVNSSNDAYQVCDGWTFDGWPASLYEDERQRSGSMSLSPRSHHNENSPAPPPAGTWPWALVKKVASGAARGMTYLHSGTPPVLHRDLKSANLLLDESYNAKVCDFGLSRLKAQERSMMTGNCGTVQWMAPEVLANERYAEPADVFSFGVILWELLSRECPYDGMDPIPCALAVLNKHERPTIPSWCPPDFATLIRQCWDQDPTNRPTFLQVLAALDDMD